MFNIDLFKRTHPEYATKAKSKLYLNGLKVWKIHKFEVIYKNRTMNYTFIQRGDILTIKKYDAVIFEITILYGSIWEIIYFDGISCYNFAFKSTSRGVAYSVKKSKIIPKDFNMVVGRLDF